MQFPFFSHIEGELRSLGGIDHAEDYVVQFGKFWNEDAVAWLQQATKLDAQLVLPFPLGNDVQPSEARSFLKNILSFCRTCLAREMYDQALEASSVLIAAVYKTKPIVRMPEGFLLEACTVRARALIQVGESEAALTFLEKEELPRAFMWAHVVSALAAERVTTKERTFCHHFARRTLQACRQRIADGKQLVDMADDAWYVASHTTQRLLAGLARNRGSIGVLCQLDTEPSLCDLPVSFSKCELAATLRKEGLAASNLTLVRMLYAVPQEWSKRAALISPTDIETVFNELHMKFWLHSDGEVAQHVRNRVSHCYRDKLAKLSDNDAFHFASEEPDADLMALFEPSRDITSDLDLDEVQVPGCGLIRVSEGMMIAVLKRHGGETSASAAKALVELWSSYCTLLQPKEDEKDWEKRAVDTVFEYVLASRLLSLLSDGSEGGWGEGVARRIDALLNPLIPADEYEGMKTCCGCGLVGGIKYSCGKCKVTQYCGVDCQKRHWKQEHKAKCSPTGS
jgi:hypothetical protein